MLDSILLCLLSFYSLLLLLLDYLKVLVLPFPSSPSPSFIPYLAGYSLFVHTTAGSETSYASTIHRVFGVSLE